MEFWFETLNEQNKLVLTGLLKPPKLVMYPNMEPQNKSFKNHSEIINQLNHQFKKFNKEINGVETLSFSSWGSRSVKSANGDRVIFHNFADWREYPNLNNCLHLNNYRRGQMFNCILNYVEKVLIPENKKGTNPLKLD